MELCYSALSCFQVGRRSAHEILQSTTDFVDINALTGCVPTGRHIVGRSSPDDPPLIELGDIESCLPAPLPVVEEDEVNSDEASSLAMCEEVMNQPIVQEIPAAIPIEDVDVSLVEHARPATSVLVYASPSLDLSTRSGCSSFCQVHTSCGPPSGVTIQELNNLLLSPPSPESVPAKRSRTVGTRRLVAKPAVVSVIQVASPCVPLFSQKRKTQPIRVAAHRDSKGSYIPLPMVGLPHKQFNVVTRVLTNQKPPPMVIFPSKGGDYIGHQIGVKEWHFPSGSLQTGVTVSQPAASASRSVLRPTKPPAPLKKKVGAVRRGRPRKSVALPLIVGRE